MGKTKTKEDIAQIMSDDLYEPMTTAKQHLEAAIKAVKKALRQGESIQIRGFGTFSSKLQVGKSAYNFRTGEHYLMDPRTVVKFKPSKNILTDDEA